ncbi:hypothetical protein CBM2592_A280108 [Cupriavidus taiwanensis]|nr:hypothetical protein CBM2592_A280108 [Cupriavidus taiwanensis]SOY85753.1 hypothetical protein CBM2591_A320109 [Cupriavidus taiwanensis]SPA15638.1 hypothetical protein CBM2631_A320011 [Cupriavidus taiwanensis]SPD44879.1 protein of unknown function [Cupriavidus taiwanensis]
MHHHFRRTAPRGWNGETPSASDRPNDFCRLAANWQQDKVVYKRPPRRLSNARNEKTDEQTSSQLRFAYVGLLSQFFQSSGFASRLYFYRTCIQGRASPLEQDGDSVRSFPRRLDNLERRPHSVLFRH